MDSIPAKKPELESRLSQVPWKTKLYLSHKIGMFRQLVKVCRHPLYAEHRGKVGRLKCVN